MKAFETLELVKLDVLREAAAGGIEAAEQGACREFGSFVELGDYLKAATDKIINGTVVE
jgi:hypothetical protein